MANDPRQLIQRIFGDVMNQRQLDSIDELFSEDYGDHGPGVVLHGREEFKQAATMWLDAFPDVKVDVSHVVVEGDTAA